MNDDYLWDRTGPPDPELEHLEGMLAPLRYRHSADLVEGPHGLRGYWGAIAAVAAVIAVATGMVVWAPQAAAVAWQVDSLHGRASLGSRDAAVDMSLRAGQTVRTGSDTEITLRADEFGTIQIGPDSELRASGNRRMELQRGVLQAYIWAPPRQFVLETPSARAVDLGCQYTITVDPSGDGLLRVSLGWVAFQYRGEEAFIPAGAACITRKRQGPGIPFYEDTAEPFRKSLAAFEKGDEAALDGILEAARVKDGITLWHLLTRVSSDDRGRVFDRFRQLIALPATVRREDVLRRGAHAIDLCWDALNLEDTDWWRGWESRWGS